jgi:hypothetical protein
MIPNMVHPDSGPLLIPIVMGVIFIRVIQPITWRTGTNTVVVAVQPEIPCRSLKKGIPVGMPFSGIMIVVISPPV